MIVPMWLLLQSLVKVVVKISNRMAVKCRRTNVYEENGTISIVRTHTSHPRKNRYDSHAIWPTGSLVSPTEINFVFLPNRKKNTDRSNVVASPICVHVIAHDKLPVLPRKWCHCACPVFVCVSRTIERKRRDRIDGSIPKLNIKRINVRRVANVA